MAYPTNYNGSLNPNSVYNLIFNMIISQEVFADIKDTKSSLVDEARIDGSKYGDTKLYYDTDVLETYAWGLPADEASKLLELNLPDSPQCQPITMDVFRQIRLSTEKYRTKQAWIDENAFTQFNSIMLGWIRNTKKVYDSTTYNTAIGTFETNEGKQTILITLPTDANNKEAENRLQAQTIATKVADVLVDLEDVSRDYNDYENLKSFTSDEFRYVWNSAFVNKINKLDLPTIFHKDFIDKFAEYTLPSRYFGDIVVKGTAVTSDGASYRSLIEQDVTLVEEMTFKGKTLNVGDTLHLFAGDLIPNKIVLANATAVLVPSYKENSNIILKIVHKKDFPYMSGFEVATEFVNPRSHTSTNYLTYGHNTLTHLHSKPFITLKVTE